MKTFNRQELIILAKAARLYLRVLNNAMSNILDNARLSTNITDITTKEEKAILKQADLLLKK